MISTKNSLLVTVKCLLTPPFVLYFCSIKKLRFDGSAVYLSQNLWFSLSGLQNHSSNRVGAYFKLCWTANFSSFQSQFPGRFYPLGKWTSDSHQLVDHKHLYLSYTFVNCCVVIWSMIINKFSSTSSNGIRSKQEPCWHPRFVSIISDKRWQILITDNIQKSIIYYIHSFVVQYSFS